MQRRQFPKGEIIIHQGETGSRAWLIEEGQVEVFRVTPEGQTVSLAVVGKGAVVGEMALIDDGVRSASARTVSPVSCVEIDRKSFRQLIAKSQPLAAYLLESLVAAIRRSHGLAQQERSIGGSDIRAERGIDKLVNRRLFNAGYVFFKQGEPGGTAYLIQTGEVVIVRDGPSGYEELAHLGPGRIFGELALLTDEPRRAGAIAKTQASCEIISKQAFNQSLASMPPILRALTRIYVTQLSRIQRVAAVPAQEDAPTIEAVTQAWP